MLSGVATSLGARQVCQRAFDLSTERTVVPVQVSDREAVETCLTYLDNHRMLVEPACGAALALLYEKMVSLGEFSNVLVIVCGGATTTIESLSSFRG